MTPRRINSLNTSHPLPQFPSRFDNPPPPAPPRRLGAAEAAAPEPLHPRRHFRRGPFYLKIDGLTGPRPRYDEFGNPIADAET